MPGVYATVSFIFLSILFAQNESVSIHIPSYRIEVWVFLFLCGIFIWVFYNKKGTYTEESPKAKLKHVVDEYDTESSKPKVAGEIELERINFVDLDYKKEASLPSEDIKSKVDTKDLAKKLKKLKK